MVIKKRWKRCTYHYTNEDIAHACGISTRTLLRIRKKEALNLKGMPFKDLVAFINKISQKKEPQDNQ